MTVITINASKIYQLFFVKLNTFLGTMVEWFLLSSRITTHFFTARLYTIVTVVIKTGSDWLKKAGPRPGILPIVNMQQGLAELYEACSHYLAKGVEPMLAG